MKNFYQNNIVLSENNSNKELNKNIRFDKFISSMPALLARSCIFTYKKRAMNEFISERVVFESDDGRLKLLASGAELNQTDYTNFLAILNKAFNVSYNDGGFDIKGGSVTVHISQNDHVRLLNKANLKSGNIGQRNKDTLINSCKRLAQKTLIIQTFKNKYKKPSKQIIFNMFKKVSIDSTGSTIEIDILMLYLFYHVTWIDSNFRKSIKSDFSKSLYSFICTYKTQDNYAYININNLMQVLAPDADKYKFVEMLKRSLKELTAMNVIDSGFNCSVKGGLKYRKLITLPSIKNKRKSEYDNKEYIIKKAKFDSLQYDCFIPF